MSANCLGWSVVIVFAVVVASAWLTNHLAVCALMARSAIAQDRLDWGVVVCASVTVAGLLWMVTAGLVLLVMPSG